MNATRTPVANVHDAIVRGYVSGPDAMGRTRYHGPAIDRLNSRLSAAEGGCLEYALGRNPKGYGAMGVAGIVIFTHRIAWIARHGDIPEGMFVLHRCDNPPCCNPDHLFLGTSKDNTQDMLEKGRGVAPIDLDNGRARLSRDDVRAMREARSQGKSVKSIAEQFGVHASHASRVLRGLCRQAVQ